MTTYTGKEFEPVFFDRMHQWFVGGCKGPDPRGEWEGRHCPGCEWGRHGIDKFRGDEWEYRWKPAKPRTVIIDGVELIAPEREAPMTGTAFFIVVSDGAIIEQTWGSNIVQNGRLAFGNVFLTREAAQAMADVQRKQRLGEV